MILIGHFEYQAVAGGYFPPRRIPPGEFEVEIVLNGGGEYRLADGGWAPLAVGDLWWFYEGDEVEGRSDARHPYEVLVLQFSGVSRFPRRSRVGHWRDRIECRGFCGRLQLQLAAAAELPPEFAAALEARLYWETLEAEAEERRAGRHPALQRALTLIHRRFRAPLTIGEISRQAGVSVPHLHTLFRRYCGTSPAKMLHELRLEHARNLLQLGDRPIKEIAAACAFADVGNFIAAFKKRYGVTPGALRRG